MLATAVALGTDAFAVATAISAGLPQFTTRHTFRLAWHFGLFQSLMTFLGWAGGEGLTILLSGVNHWIAFAILVALGFKMIFESSHSQDINREFDPTRGWSLVGLAVATSLDALAIGVSLRLIGSPIAIPALVIGLVALVMTFSGTRIGMRAGPHLGQWAERLGGVVLMLIGVKVLIDYLRS